MVSVTCLCVGKELLIGKTVNTNAHWIGARLFGIGTMLDRVLIVTDSLDEISSGLEELLERRPDFIIVVGGLGPTPDDMTLKGVALAVGKRIKLSGVALSMIKEYYASIGRTFELTPARRKMATLPEGSTPLPNGAGTAPGVRIEHSGAVIFCLPGVPREMKRIYKTSVQPEIRKKVGKLYTSKVVMHLMGVYESTLAPQIAEALKHHPSAYIKSHPKGVKEGKSSVELDLVVVSTKRQEAESECDVIARFFEGKIADAGGSVAKKTVSTVGR
jgi:molybdenum cofactor synthesis domain-containing protein